MRPCRVVVSDPGTDDLVSLIEIEEQALVEELIAHAAVEGFDVAVLHGLAKCDVVPFHLLLRPRIAFEVNSVLLSLRSKLARHVLTSREHFDHAQRTDAASTLIAG